MALLPESHGRARALAPTKRATAGRRIVGRYMSVRYRSKYDERRCLRLRRVEAMCGNERKALDVIKILS